MKFGDWVRDRDTKELLFIIYDKSHERVHVVDKSGLVTNRERIRLVPLPGCTGWDWRAPLQVRRGAYYETNDGKVVGPAIPYDARGQVVDGMLPKWSLGPCWYTDDGKNPTGCLVREVPPPEKPPRDPEDVGKTVYVRDSYHDRWVKRRFVGAVGANFPFATYDQRNGFKEWKLATLINPSR